MLFNTAIKTKLKLFVAFILVIQSALALFLVLKLVDIESHVKEIEYKNIPVVEQITAIQLAQTEQAVLFEQAFRIALEKEAGLGNGSHFQQVVNDFNQLGAQIEVFFQQADTLIAQAKNEATNGNSLQKLTNAEQSLAMINQHYRRLSADTQQAITALQRHDLPQAELQVESIEQQGTQMLTEVSNLRQKTSDLIRMNVQGVEAETATLERGTLLASLVCILFTLLIAFTIIRAINQGLKKAEQGLTQLAEGDFSQPLDQNEPGEIGQLLKRMERTRNKVGVLLEMVRRSSLEVNDAATSLAAVSHQVQSNTHIQAREVAQVNKAIQQLTTNTDKVADDSVATQRSTEAASLDSEQSLKANTRASVATKQLMDNLQNSVQTFEQLEATSTQMNEMLDTIKGVAEQTNLLALNAAIEAARAGEQGRGFAVVADEVRQLAMRTQNSAEQITDLVERFSLVSRKAADNMLSNRDIGQQTLKYADDATQSLYQVNEAIVTVKDMNNRIASAAEAQGEVAQDVSLSIAHVNQTVEEGAAMVDQIAAACQQLSDTAGQLQGEMSQFRLSPA